MSAHAAFILAAYLLTLAVIGGAALAILLDYRNLRRALSKLPPRDGDEPRP
ncbi:MAG: hypothetical protein JWN93_3822 [Hyphomicrobiales bacterium]|jgi:heme exporter protein CcmD|nr:hypothetical protein [Hyphomicrobiales bacterium]